MRRIFALVLLLILSTSSSIMFESAYAQSIPRPSVPEFAIHIVAPSVTRNTTYYLDSNTGQIVANIGYINQFSLITLTIKNQPFDPSDGSLYYNIRFKSHDANDAAWSVVRYDDSPNPKQTTNFDFTNISLQIEGQWSVPSLAGTQTDIQVQAMLGNFNYENGLFTGGFVFAGVASDWSNTQTVNVPANIPLSATPATSPYSTITPSSTSTSPTSPEKDNNQIYVPLTALIAVVIVFVVIIASLLLILYRRPRKYPTAS